MPALPPVAKVIRVDLFHTVGSNSRVRDRFFLLYTGAGPAVADLNTLMTTMSTAWFNNLSPLQSTNTTLTLIQLTDLTSAIAAQSSQTQSRVGTVASAAAAGIVPVLKFRLARRYRGGHPRLYFPGFPTGNLLTSTQWNPSSLSALVGGWNGFITAVVTAPPAAFGNLSQVNVSYFQGFTNITLPSGRAVSRPKLRSGGPVTDGVISISTNPNVASQRRRNQQSI